jgi:type IV pilus assembly protein PilY1
MRFINSKFSHFFFSLFLSTAASITWADDTEIFFNIDTQTSIRPNILFILDNSGSMSSRLNVTVPQDGVYDPNKDYSGARNNNFIYYKDSGSWYTVRRSVLTCTDLLSRIDQVGELSSYRMAYFYQLKWNSFDKINVNNSTTDCEADNDRALDWSRFSLQDYYSANYLNWSESGDTTVRMTRMEVMQSVAKNLADTVTGVNIGLMAFNQSQPSEGGRVVNNVTDVQTNAVTFKSEVDALYASGNTPLSETLFGAMRYFQGKAPFLDNNPRSDTVNADGTFKSPIELECQSNNIILLTDGEPTSDTNHNSEIRAEIGANCSGNCLDEIAGYIKNNDMLTSARFPGDQTITTYTVGFQINDSLLADTATAGGGKYYPANDAQALAVAFKDVFRTVLETSSTFVAPGVAVNSFNRLNHFNALYYSVFEPETRPLWDGNLKRYKISNDGSIVDVNGNQAIDAATGFFKDNAKSWWALTPDGKAVQSGGVRSRLPDVTSNRKVFSWLNGKNLSDSDNLITVSNASSITKELLGDGSMSDTQRNVLISWIRGEDAVDSNGDGNRSDPRKFIADPLHSEPKLIVYGGTEASPDTTVFFGDNQGFIHAIDGETGDSYFSFMPPELLKNQSTLMANSDTVANRLYGIDGSIVSWVKNPNDGINSADGDHVYLYTGMRRGGRSYYALDATERTAPKAMWKISGGSGDFAELGQSWSTPVKSKINIDGTVKDVLFIAGGYDTNQDSAITRSEDSMGRALYIVDALTGQRIWWAGSKVSSANLKLDDMKYSMPASPKVLDIDNDGLADQVYIGDMGGQLWRFDLNNGAAVGSLATGGPIANLAGSAETNARRFYHTPDLSISRYWGKRYLTLLVGSGYQAHPLDKAIEDRTYMIRIPSMLGAPLDPVTNQVKYTPITESNLMDITSNIIGEGTVAEKLTAEETLAGKSGWMLKFGNPGEKMLSSSIVVDGVATFTTYEPAPALSACAPSTGRSRLYTASLRDGRPVRNYDQVDADTELTTGDRSKDISISGIPPSPKLLRTEDASFICVGTSCEQVEDSNSFTQTFWREAE